MFWCPGFGALITSIVASISCFCTLTCSAILLVGLSVVEIVVVRGSSPVSMVLSLYVLSSNKIWNPWLIIVAGGVVVVVVVGVVGVADVVVDSVVFRDVVVDGFMEVLSSALLVVVSLI